MNGRTVSQNPLKRGKKPPPPPFSTSPLPQPALPPQHKVTCDVNSHDLMDCVRSAVTLAVTWPFKNPPLSLSIGVRWPCLPRKACVRRYRKVNLRGLFGERDRWREGGRGYSTGHCSTVFRRRPVLMYHPPSHTHTHTHTTHTPCRQQLTFWHLTAKPRAQPRVCRYNVPACQMGVVIGARSQSVCQCLRCRGKSFVPLVFRSHVCIYLPSCCLPAVLARPEQRWCEHALSISV